MWGPKRIAEPGWFLDRADERRSLAALVKARDNVLVYGQRRLGKTSLLRRVAEDLQGIPFLLVDCNFADSEAELSHVLLAELRRTRLGRLRRFLGWARRAAQDLEIGVEVRGDAVIPTLRLGAPRARPLEDTLEFITRIARSSRTHVVIVLDEFQTIMGDSHASVAKLRDHAQRQSHVSYVLAGSQPSVLLNLTRFRSPFWKQLTEFRVGVIDVDAALADAARLTKGRVPKAVREEIRSVTRGNTQRLAEILSFAWARRRSLSLASVRDAVEVVAGRHEGSFERILGQLTAVQRRVALALAVAEPRHPTGARFIREHDLGSPSNVQKAMKGLQRAEVLDEGGAFIDPLFAWWLRRGAAARDAP